MIDRHNESMGIGRVEKHINMAIGREEKHNMAIGREEVSKIPDKKLTDSEIVKGYCERKLCPPAQEIINRLQAEVKEFKRQIAKLHTDLAVSQIKLNTANAENERLKVEKASNHKDLQQVCVMLDELKEDIAHDIKLAKAEAYKEVFEKLNDKSIRSKAKVKGCSFLYVSVVTLHDINTLKKELVGDNDG